jgi:hypothetical protein
MWRPVRTSIAAAPGARSRSRDRRSAVEQFELFEIAAMDAVAH